MFPHGGNLPGPYLHKDMVNHIHIPYSDHSVFFLLKTYPHNSLQKYRSDFFRVIVSHPPPESLTVVLAVSCAVSGLLGRLASASKGLRCAMRLLGWKCLVSYLLTTLIRKGQRRSKTFGSKWTCLRKTVPLISLRMSSLIKKINLLLLLSTITAHNSLLHF